MTHLVHLFNFTSLNEKRFKMPGPTQYNFAQLRQVRKKAAVSERICAVGLPGFFYLRPEDNFNRISLIKYVLRSYSPSL